MRKDLPAREDVDIELTWRLEDIYPSDDDFEKDMKEAEELSEEFAALEGKSAENAAALLQAFDLYEKISLLEQRFLGYASMRNDQDTSSQEGQSSLKRAESLSVKIARRCAFFESEILALSEDTIKAYYAQEEGLRKYQVTIKDIFRTKEHSLSAELEKTAAAAGEMAGVPYTAFSMMADADLTFPSVTDDQGQEVVISNGRFVPLETTGSRPLRKEVFEKFYGRYAEFKDLWAALYDDVLCPPQALPFRL